MATTRSPLAPNLPLTVDYNWHLARRASHGPTRALAAEIRTTGRAAWIDKQLKPASIPDTTCDKLLAKIPAHKATAKQNDSVYWTDGTSWKSATVTARAARIRQLTSKRVLLEVMVEFWHDVLHVNGSADAPGVSMSDFDTFVIRKHALGSFPALLRAATTHMAMLGYLSNDVSTKWTPNENLGRELLELHTLGVGNFTETDVKAMAKLLTGWSIDWDARKSYYVPSWHHVGALTIVGKKVTNASAGAGPADLNRVLDHLALHPATARTLCTRLARRFVSDNPPASLISKMAATYIKGKGAIAPVVRQMLLSKEFNASIGQKWSRPQEWMAKMTRARRPTSFTIASDWRKDPWRVLDHDAWLLEGGAHIPFEWGPPDGYPDQAEKWMHSNAMLAAFNAAESAAGAWDKNVKYQTLPAACGVTTRMDARTAATALVKNLTGHVPNKVTVDGIASLLYNGKATGSTPKGVAVGADRLRWHLPMAVRVTMSSPYFLLR